MHAALVHTRFCGTSHLLCGSSTWGQAMPQNDPRMTLMTAVNCELCQQTV